MSRLPQPQQPLCHGPRKEEWERAHEAMKTDEVRWSSLALDGIQSDGGAALIEHRRCPACGSSISRHTTALQAVEILSSLAGIHARSLEAIARAATVGGRLGE